MEILFVLGIFALGMLTGAALLVYAAYRDE